LYINALYAKYYPPGGMLIPGRNFHAGNYRYSFVGQEDDSEIKGIGNSTDFGARIYDPRISRFLSLDQFSREYPMYSDYIYAANNPLALVDKDGKFIGTIIGAVAGGVIAAVRGESVWKGATAGAIAGAAADIIIFTGGTGAIALVAAGTVSGAVGSAADQMIVQGKTLDQLSGSQIAFGAGLGAGFGYFGAKLAGPVSRSLGKLFGKSQTPAVNAGPLTTGKINFVDDIVNQAKNVKPGLKYENIGTATFDDAMSAGEKFVGENATKIFNKDGSLKELISESGLRRFRAPRFKEGQNRTQANFESRPSTDVKFRTPSDGTTNAHLDIIE
jgi:RHS repeat-associated protein